MKKYFKNGQFTNENTTLFKCEVQIFVEFLDTSFGKNATHSFKRSRATLHLSIFGLVWALSASAGSRDINFVSQNMARALIGFWVKRDANQTFFFCFHLGKVRCWYTSTQYYCRDRKKPFIFVLCKRHKEQQQQQQKIEKTWFCVNIEYPIIAQRTKKKQLSLTFAWREKRAEGNIGKTTFPAFFLHEPRVLI